MSKNELLTELSKGIVSPDSPSLRLVLPFSWSIEREYWSAKLFPKIRGVFMSLTMYTSSFRETGFSSPKIKSSGTY